MPTTQVWFFRRGQIWEIFEFWAKPMPHYLRRLIVRRMYNPEWRFEFRTGSTN